MPEVSMFMPSPAPKRSSSAILIALFAAFVLAGCSATPAPILAQTDPADALAPVRPVAYRPVTAGYQSQRPVEPRPWREQNDRVAPSR
jgi:hypothetical protein